MYYFSSVLPSIITMAIPCEQASLKLPSSKNTKFPTGTMDPALFSDLLLPRYKQHNIISPKVINRALQSQLFYTERE